MGIELNGEVFVMIFLNELVFGFVQKTIAGNFIVEDTGFSAVDDNFLSAFWDRLLDSRGELVGVRVTPVSPPAEELRDAVRGLPYVTGRGPAFDVWLTEGPIADAYNNGEQAFGGRVFRSDAGRFALSIDAGSLFISADEGRLANAHGKWATIVH